jgi:hypothetical protein
VGGGLYDPSVMYDIPVRPSGYVVFSYAPFVSIPVGVNLGFQDFIPYSTPPLRTRPPQCHISAVLSPMMGRYIFSLYIYRFGLDNIERDTCGLPSQHRVPRGHAASRGELSGAVPPLTGKS